MNLTILNLLRQYWQQIAIIGAVLIFLSAVYLYAYNAGYDAMEAKTKLLVQAWQQKFTEQQIETAKKEKEYEKQTLDTQNQLDDDFAFIDSLPAKNSSSGSTLPKTTADCRKLAESFRQERAGLSKTIYEKTAIIHACKLELQIGRE